VRGVSKTTFAHYIGAIPAGEVKLPCQHPVAGFSVCDVDYCGH
jgi:hypothetical protein